MFNRGVIAGETASVIIATSTIGTLVSSGVLDTIVPYFVGLIGGGIYIAISHETGIIKDIITPKTIYTLFIAMFGGWLGFNLIPVLIDLPSDNTLMIQKIAGASSGFLLKEILVAFMDRKESVINFIINKGSQILGINTKNKEKKG
jgi:hypothetical protein